jgi:hypothetical protein
MTMLMVTDNAFCSQNVFLEAGTTDPLPWLMCPILSWFTYVQALSECFPAEFLPYMA